MEIRKFSEEDEDAIRSLFTLCFNKELSHEVWLWKYKGAPWGSAAMVAVDDNHHIIAHYGGVRTRFYFKGKTLNAFQFCDVMTHPKYRGRFVSKTPIIVRLGEMFYKKNPMDFAFGFPSIRHARLQSIRLGGEGYRLVRLYKKEHLKRHFVLWKLKVREGWEFFDRAEFSKYSIKSDNSFLQIAKNKDYIKWRYMENPLRKYRLLVFKKLNITRGYIIFTIQDAWFNILEVFYRDERELKHILISIEAYAINNIDDVKGIKAWFHPKEPLIGYLDYLGYIYENSIPLAFRLVNVNCGISSEIFYDSYCYRMGDYDDS